MGKPLISKQSAAKSLKAAPVVTKQDDSPLGIIRTFTRNLEKALSDTGTVSSALSVKLGFDKQYISKLIKYETEPKLSTVVRIAKGIGVSLDMLAGIQSGGVKANTPQKAAVPEVDVNVRTINFINKISKMHDQDVELLDAISGILDDRRARGMVNLHHAVKDAKPVNKKDGLMSKAISKSKSHKPFADEFEDDEFGDEDFDEEDDEFGDDLDFDDDE